MKQNAGPVAIIIAVALLLIVGFFIYKASFSSNATADDPKYHAPGPPRAGAGYGGGQGH